MLTPRPAVVAVVPSLGGNPERLIACVEATVASTLVEEPRVVVVWNDPRSPVPDMSPAAQVLRPGLNLGFPAALNHARSRVDADFLWILQDDVRPAPDCLRTLLDWMEADDEIGVAAPVTLNEDGLVPAGCRGGFLRPDGAMESWFPPFDCVPEQLDLARPLSYVASSGALVRMSVWDGVGGFDPEFYPLLWSDVDFCYRVRKAGHRVELVPRAVIHHDQHGSTPGLLAAFLHHANGIQFRSKTEASAPAAQVPLDVPDALSRIVARSASLTLVDFARYASKALGAEQERAADFEQKLAREVPARERRIAELEQRLRSEIVVRDQQIARLRRSARARQARIRALENDLARLRASRAWRTVRAVRRVRRSFSSVVVRARR